VTGSEGKGAENGRGHLELGKGQGVRALSALGFSSVFGGLMCNFWDGEARAWNFEDDC
jgi:hypothetical protein